MSNNIDRAEYGHRAIEAGSPDLGRNDKVTDLVDTLANLLHYATDRDLDFDTALTSARAHYSAEMEFKCANCEHTEAYEETLPAEDLSSRLVYGGVYTDRECSECGALTYKQESGDV